MAKNFDAIFKQIEAHSISIAQSAMYDAAQEAYQLAIEKAESCLQNYYKRKPKIYKRTYTLKNAIVPRPPKWHKHRGDNYSIDFGIVYDSSKLTGKYKSNSKWHQSGGKWRSRFNDGKFNPKSSANGTPDSDWILKNYLLGIHPGWLDDEWRGWIDDENTEDTMEDFFITELPQIASDLVFKSMQSAIMNFLK